MAILQRIISENGVPLNYHRIAMVNVQLNQQITILVESYVDETGRLYEKDYAVGNIEEEPTFPYTNGEYLNTPWDECEEFLTGSIIAKAYAWLKRQPAYIGAQDA